MGGNINRDMVIIASEIEHKVAIVDILSGSPVLTVVSLRYETFMTAQRNRRQVEWVIGTPYVWIDGTGDRELYVLNTDTKQVEKTIRGIETIEMLSVENYERKFITNLITREVSEAISDNESDDESSDVFDDESDDEFDDESDDVNDETDDASDNADGDMCSAFEVFI